MFYIFTYGTLMKNHRNNFLLENQKFIDNFKLYNCYIRLEDCSSVGSYNYPVLFVDENKQYENCCVEGEIYKCEDYILPYLDMLEGVGTLYDRYYFVHTIDNEEVKVYLYVGKKGQWDETLMPLIKNGVWDLSYETEGV